MVAIPTPTETQLAPSELAFQCLALSKAAVLVLDAPVREALLFILMDKTETLYRMIEEG